MFSETAYLSWANRHFPQARYNLAKGGLKSVALPPVPDVQRLCNSQAPETLRERIAYFKGVPSCDVVASLGATQALFLAFAAQLEPGDEVVVERPAYEPLWRIPQGLGAKVLRFDRFRDKGDWCGLVALRKRIGPRTKLVVITNPNNPCGHRMSRAELLAMAEICDEVGALLVVDEIYDAFGHRVDSAGCFQATARHLADNVVSVSALSKAYGLGALRVGWLLAPPSLVARCEHILQSVMGDPAQAQSAMGLWAFENILELDARREAHFNADTLARVDGWVSQNPLLSWERPVDSPFGLVELRAVSGFVDSDLEKVLHRGFLKHGVLVAPGHYFDRPRTFRLGWALASEDLGPALAQLERVLIEAFEHVELPGRRSGQGMYEGDGLDS